MKLNIEMNEYVFIILEKDIVFIFYYSYYKK